MTTITRRAPAKVNLYLEISSRRPDGYHNIESVMQTVTLFDELTFEKSEAVGQNITLTCDGGELPCDGTNLCHRAAKLFFEAAGVDNYGLSMHIDKHIPISAGLGGGSSDAAATLTALNELYSAGFSKSELCAIGARLGADIPFCIMQGISVTRGIGDVFSPCAHLPDCHIVIACHGEGVSTPWAYKKLDEMYDFDSRNVCADDFAALIGGGELKVITAGMTNIFESAVLPERAAAREIRERLSKAGALRAMMSGSGPSVVGIFDSENTARSAQRMLLDKGITAHLCKPYYPDEA
ncbi:MAG: 4-(cytidine 5'-diphospho)-2-C-methyl-D-erythritol kinase [Clostridia bacterium]|nr:4-(cytidine 5'-diphospho)-2-C-methyl-D-erythritol kinase [Clostridia bacterium]